MDEYLPYEDQFTPYKPNHCVLGKTFWDNWSLTELANEISMPLQKYGEDICVQVSGPTIDRISNVDIMIHKLMNGGDDE